MENVLITPNKMAITNKLFQPANASEYVKTARKAFNSGNTRQLKFRETQLKNLQKMYEETKQEMIEALMKDLRKPQQESIICEIVYLQNDVNNILMHFKNWTKPENTDKDLMNLLNQLQIYNDPYGVVLIMGAWNYPLQVTLLPLAGAIAGGNCIILKPSEISKASTRYIAETLPRYIDSECYQVFEGGINETKELLNERFDYIFFTGSSNVGKIVHQAAAKYLTPVTLELGGKSPTYIDESADMRITASRVLWGKIINAGQTCIAPDYILCTKQVQDRLLIEFRSIITEWFGNNPQESPDFGRIISEQHFNRLVNLLQNSTIAIGGQIDAKERYIAPTILINVHANDPVMNEEIFGPILPIYNINSVMEAVDFINAREKPLALYIFSSNKSDIDFILNSTSSGGACVNDVIMQCATEYLPFGGVGNSGMGRYHGKLNFDIFVHKKSVLKNSFYKVPEKLMSCRYPPYSDFKTNYSHFFIKKRFEFPTEIVKYVLVFLAGVIVSMLLF